MREVAEPPPTQPKQAGAKQPGGHSGGEDPAAQGKHQAKHRAGGGHGGEAAAAEAAQGEGRQHRNKLDHQQVPPTQNKETQQGAGQAAPQ